MTPWEKKIWLRICQKKPIDGKDIHTLVENYEVDYKSVGYSNTLFNIEINTIIKFNNHYYSINWICGDTEGQDIYSAQILKEVVKTKKVVEVEEWIEK